MCNRNLQKACQTQTMPRGKFLCQPAQKKNGKYFILYI